MDELGRQHDATGRAYGRPPQHPDDELVRVGPGTPMGELFRRYWLPVGMSADLGTRPVKLRILGEDLVLFRDLKGRPGLLYSRCMHRGTTLFYGHVEDEGLRCCYHGWLFGVDGTCLDQPCEPEHGRRRDLARQPWYPVAERYGLIFAYLGPAERQPVLPRFDILEDRAADETIVPSQGGAQTGDQTVPVAPYSWLHLNDNVMDPYHVWILHSTFSGPQFATEFQLPPEKADFFRAEQGVCYSIIRQMEDGSVFNRVSSFMMPSLMSVPATRDIVDARSTRISWIMPIDDEHFTTYTASKVKPGEAPFQLTYHGSKLWHTMTEAEHQDNPGDFEAQAGQGAVSLHSEEHLVMSDRGIAMMRRMLRDNIKTVADGGNPLGVAFDEKDATVRVPSGNFIKARDAAE
jgi:phenylpropionate dioxygenase-like ring-hydroxylating dioxygenase large terminal subunit